MQLLREPNPKLKKSQKRSDSTISSEESPSKKKPVKAKKDVPSTKKPLTKPKPTKKKAPVKADRGKCLNVLLEVALSETAQLKEATKRSKKDFHISHVSGPGDGTDFESRVPDEQQYKISSVDEGTGTKPGVPNVRKYDLESKKESWGDSREEDDSDEDDSEEESDDDKGNDDMVVIMMIMMMIVIMKGLSRTEMRILISISTMKNMKKGLMMKKRWMKKKIMMSLRSWFEHVEEDAHVTLTAVENTQKTKGPMQSFSVSSDFTSKILNLENVSLADNDFASLMDTTVCHEELQ
ncbi:hypothetical protein Tco_0522220 [Tanacetum coccineum]